MNKKSWLRLLIVIVFALLISACQADDPQTSEETSNEAAETPLEENEQASKAENDTYTAEGDTYTVTDDKGTEFTFESVPETVISLQPSNTEILFALGAGEKVVGVTDFDNYPEEVQDIERVSDTVNINAERILELDPDVVFAYTIGEKESVEPLEKAGIPVFVIQSASSFEDVYDDISQIAAVMGVTEKGEQLIEDIRSQIEDVQEKVETIEDQKQIYLEISPAPDMYTAGKNTFQEEILENAGVQNIFADQEGWLKVSAEDIILRDPALIATTVNHVADPVAEIKSRSGWDEITAIQNDEVYALDPDVMTRPGPRIGEAVEAVASIAYPDHFHQEQE